MGVCLDEIYNHMAKIHLVAGGNVKLPIVLMTASAGATPTRPSTRSACRARSRTCRA